jgi:hypothetical protein
MVNVYDIYKPDVVGYGEILPPNLTYPTRAYPYFGFWVPTMAVNKGGEFEEALNGSFR